MSKLAHSHQPTMDELDRRRAIEDGNEDLLPPISPALQRELDQSLRNAIAMGKVMDNLLTRFGSK
jgi:hypothetical protein